MTRDGNGNLLDRCPPWCIEQSHIADSMINIKTHVTASETFVPASSNDRHNTVSVAIGQSESLEDGVPEVSPVVLMLGADDAELTAGEARRVATILLGQADKLDQIAGRTEVPTDVYALAYQAGHLDGTHPAT